MKRVCTPEFRPSIQNPEAQAIDLRRLAQQLGLEIVHEHTERISGAKDKRPALDQMLSVRPKGGIETNRQEFSQQ